MLETGTSNAPQPEKAVLVRITEKGGYISSASDKNSFGRKLLKTFGGDASISSDVEFAVKSEEPVTVSLEDLNGDRLGQLGEIKNLILKKVGEKYYLIRVKIGEKYVNIPKADKVPEAEVPTTAPKPVPAKASSARPVETSEATSRQNNNDFLTSIFHDPLIGVRRRSGGATQPGTPEN